MSDPCSLSCVRCGCSHGGYCVCWHSRAALAFPPRTYLFSCCCCSVVVVAVVCVHHVLQVAPSFYFSSGDCLRVIKKHPRRGARRLLYVALLIFVYSVIMPLNVQFIKFVSFAGSDWQSNNSTVMSNNIFSNCANALMRFKFDGMQSKRSRSHPE